MRRKSLGRGSCGTRLPSPSPSCENWAIERPRKLKRTSPSRPIVTFASSSARVKLPKATQPVATHRTIGAANNPPQSPNSRVHSPTGSPTLNLNRSPPDALSSPARLGRDCGLPAFRAIPDARRRHLPGSGQRLPPALPTSPSPVRRLRASCKPRPGLQPASRGQVPRSPGERVTTSRAHGRPAGADARPPLAPFCR